MKKLRLEMLRLTSDEVLDRSQKKITGGMAPLLVVMVGAEICMWVNCLSGYKKD